MKNTGLVVAKFGGTSVSSKERVLNLCNIVEKELGRQPVVVVSALSGVTDLLLSLVSLPKEKIGRTIREINLRHKELIEELWSEKKKQREILFFFTDNWRRYPGWP